MDLRTLQAKQITLSKFQILISSFQLISVIAFYAISLIFVMAPLTHKNLDNRQNKKTFITKERVIAIELQLTKPRYTKKPNEKRSTLQPKPKTSTQIKESGNPLTRQRTEQDSKTSQLPNKKETIVNNQITERKETIVNNQITVKNQKPINIKDAIRAELESQNNNWFNRQTTLSQPIKKTEQVSQASVLEISPENRRIRHQDRCFSTSNLRLPNGESIEQWSLSDNCNEDKIERALTTSLRKYLD